MSTKEHLEDSSEEMSASLPPLKWSKEVFDGLMKNFKFPDSWGVRYPDDGQTTANTPAGYITLSGIIFPRATFDFLLQDLFLIFLVITRFYSFAQRSSVKKILLNPPKCFYEWKPKFFFIKAGVIPMRMTFRGIEDLVVESMQIPESEIWYQDLKDIPSIELPKRALVTAGMSLHWKMDREDKPLYMEDNRIVSFYVAAYKREKGKMTTIPKGAEEELWYHQIFKNFALPRDEDLAVQPSGGAGPEKKKKRVPAVTIAPKKTDAPKAQSSKAKNVREEKKGMCRFSDFWCDYIVVPDTLEGLTPVVLRKPKAEPRDTADIPASNPDNPIYLESSPEPLLRTKAVKRKQTEVEAAAQPAKKVPKRKIGKRGNLDAFVTKLPPEKLIPSFRAEPSSVFNDDLPPSSPRASIREQIKGTKAVETEAGKVAEVEKPEEVEKHVKVELEAEKIVETEAMDVGVSQPKSPEVVVREPKKGKSVQEDPVITIPFSATTSVPVNVERNPTASEIHASVWKLKKGDTVSDWQICRDWLPGTFPPAEVKFQEEHSHDQTYHAYLEETASSTSTTHRIVREWRNMHKEWDAFEASKKEASEEKARIALLRAKLEADQAKFESEQKLKSGLPQDGKEKRKLKPPFFQKSVNVGKKSADIVKLKKDNAEIEKLKKDNTKVEKLKKEKAEAKTTCDKARSHRERSEQREVQTCATLSLKNKEIDELSGFSTRQKRFTA
ncbi:hypothetical protein Hanom_Chr03g00207111 [Helianthus anomalus]